MVKIVWETSPCANTRPTETRQTRGDQGEGLRVDFVLFLENARRQGFRRIVVHNRHRLLRDYRSGVEFPFDKMNGATMDFSAGVERPSVRVESPKFGQQRGVDVDHTPAPALDERRTEDAFETREADQFDAVDIKEKLQRALKFFAAGVDFVINRRRCDAETLCQGESGRVRPIGKNEDDLGGKVGSPRRLDEGRHVRSSS